MAGAVRIELTVRVLETRGLPLTDAPTSEPLFYILLTERSLVKQGDFTLSRF